MELTSKDGNMVVDFYPVKNWDGELINNRMLKVLSFRGDKQKKMIISKNHIFPKDKRGNYISKSITKSTPRRWTKEEESWLLMLKDKGYNNLYISKCLDRNEISVQIKYKRLTK